MIPETTLPACAPATFRKALADRGAIIFRQAMSKAKVARFKAAIEPIIASYMAMTEDTLPSTWPEWFPGNGTGFVLEMAGGGNINDNMVRSASDGTLSLYDLISDPLFHTVRGAGFPTLMFKPSVVAHCRRMPPVRGVGVTLHCDIRYHRDGPFALNYWVPLDPAGEAFASPGLEIWPAGYRAVQAFIGDRLDDDGSYDPARVIATFGDGARPDLDIGDVMVFTSWTLHRTHVPDNANRPRLSAEVRMYADAQPG